MSKTADKQPKNNGDRDEKGRFVKGNNNGFKPGQSGNPAGRPKSITLSEALRMELAKANPQGDGEQTYAEAIAQMLCEQAAEHNNIMAAKEIADRTEGKPRQTVDVDMSLFDWRALAKAHGIDERDVLAEAQRIIAAESAAHSGH
jgi:hypothetical protein